MQFSSWTSMLDMWAEGHTIEPIFLLLSIVNILFLLLLF
jgi:hypothetical protein